MTRNGTRACVRETPATADISIVASPSGADGLIQSLSSNTPAPRPPCCFASERQTCPPTRAVGLRQTEKVPWSPSGTLSLTTSSAIFAAHNRLGTQ